MGIGKTSLGYRARASFDKVRDLRSVASARAGRRREPVGPGDGSTQHSEIESKFAADHVSWEEFGDWARKLDPVREERAGGVDTFYRKGKDVLRHRVGSDNDLHELTTKILTSKKSSTNRCEVDVQLASSPNDVGYLLELVGWQKELGIGKSGLMFDIVAGGVKVDFCIYDAHGTEGKALKSPPQRFIEVEVEKTPDVSVDDALSIVREWETALEEQFGLAKPMNKSLYDAFGGKGYRTAR